MHDYLSGRAAELAHRTDLIRTSLSLADAAIPLINKQLHGLAAMGIDDLELGGRRHRLRQPAAAFRPADRERPAGRLAPRSRLWLRPRLP